MEAFCGTHDLFTGGSRLCDGNIVCDGIMEQVGFLCHIAFQVAGDDGWGISRTSLLSTEMVPLFTSQKRMEASAVWIFGAAGTMDTSDPAGESFRGVVVKNCFIFVCKGYMSCFRT